MTKNPWSAYGCFGKGVWVSLTFFPPFLISALICGLGKKKYFLTDK
ncbi:hypothetical protein X474_16650 [Dethiosulfatarculus sandiegensis]|uniref:Uncharacterized protein n=1 Tax=Dethiosulfatarculus sandiegensis TaxID=1429043 RepID=A0A0D2J469_9BACT|nr:hypothetical protein X474_16650 [Dethiosulfatarculus sandiegensis]